MLRGKVLTYFTTDPKTGEDGNPAALYVVMQTEGWRRVRRYSEVQGDANPNAYIVEVWAEQAGFDALAADPGHGPASILSLEEA